jgi:hypothetical protein
MENLAIGFGSGVFFTVVLLIPAIGFIALRARQWSRNRKRRLASAKRAQNSAGVARRDNSGEPASIASVGRPGSPSSGPAGPKASPGTHGINRSTR